MPVTLAVDRYLIELPSVALSEQPDDLAARLVKIAPDMAKARRSLEEQRAKFEELYRDAEALSPDELEAVIMVLLAQERLQATILAPIVTDSERRLAVVGEKARAPAQKSVVRLLEEAHGIASGWLELYQNIRVKLAKLMSDKLAASGHPGSPVISSSEELDRYFRSITPADG